MSIYLAELKLRIPKTIADNILESYISQAVQDVRNKRAYLEEDVSKIVTDAEMFNGTYTISEQPEIPTVPSVTHESVGATDTVGVITFTGYNKAGAAITDIVTPVADSTVYGVKKFYSFDTIVGSGWTINGSADIITVGVSAEETEARWRYAILDLAEAYYNKRGATGEKIHNEGDIDRSFLTRDEILSGVTSIARAV
jgi:hypothetical protein